MLQNLTHIHAVTYMHLHESHIHTVKKNKKGIEKDRGHYKAKWPCGQVLQEEWCEQKAPFQRP